MRLETKESSVNLSTNGVSSSGDDKIIKFKIREGLTGALWSPPLQVSSLLTCLIASICHIMLQQIQIIVVSLPVISLSKQVDLWL